MLKTIIFILNKISHPELGKYVHEILLVNKFYAKDFLSQIISISPKELRQELSGLFFEKIGEVDSELKNENDIVTPIDKKELLLQKFTKRKIKKKLKENPSFLTTFNILTTKFPIDLSLGSKNSICFFRIIESMTAEQQIIFDELVLLKWRKLKPWLLVHLLLFSSMTISYNSFLYLTEKPMWLMILILSLNALISIYEIKCLFTAENYLRNYSNLADLVVFIGIYVFIPINFFTEGEHRSLSILNFFFCILLNIRSMTYFKVFDSLRYLIEMIIKIYGDIIAFLFIIILFINIYSIGLLGIDDINKVEEKDSFKDKVKVGLELALGDWDNIPDEWNDWNWFLFLCSNITFTIMLLNLIIAIVSKTFDDYYDNQTDVDRKAKLTLILELDQFFRWKICQDQFDKEKFLKNSKYYQILQKQPEAGNIEELGQQIEKTKAELKEEINGN